MGSHPINLAFRFLLELSALSAMGIWGWHQGQAGVRFLGALGVPVLAATLWGVFAVVGDPSRSGSAPVPVPGAARLVLELLFFAFAVWALSSSPYSSLAKWLGGAVLVHYAISWDRVAWLLAH